MVKKFTIPFASQGDANDIPDALQVDGKVSFTQGFGYDYERPYDDPQAKDIAREDMNGLFKAITSAVGELQTLGASEWSNAVSYPKGAIVYFEKDLYISQVDDNQNEPPQNWVSITSIANDSLKKVANLSDLTNKATARSNLGLGSSATLNKTDVLGTSTNLVATQKLVNDTKINLDNSIRAVDTFANKVNDKTDLLEANKRSISNNHFPQAGITIGSGTGWHSTLSDGLEKYSYNFAISHVENNQQTGVHVFEKRETGIVATREWTSLLVNSNRGLGYGQSWVDVTGNRTKGTTYSNSSSKPIMINITVMVGEISYPKNVEFLTVGGVPISGSGQVGREPTHTVSSLTAVIPAGVTYSLSSKVTEIMKWTELR